MTEVSAYPSGSRAFFDFVLRASEELDFSNRLDGSLKLVHKINLSGETGEFSERIGQVHGPRRIQYLNFCFVIQPGERVDQSRRVALTDEQRHVMQALDDELQVQRGPAWGSAATRMVAEQVKKY